MLIPAAGEKVMPEKWCKTPKHMLREKVIEFIIKKRTPASFLELGAGTGEITKFFLERGFNGVCYDLSQNNRKILSKNLFKYQDSLLVVEDLHCLENKSFDFLFAFEVLEHVPNDIDVLNMWTSFLKSGGEVLLSVPAHMKKFSMDDEAFGHVRRYEKEGLFKLLKESGYVNVKIYNYGFPLGNLSRMISTKLFKPRAELAKLSQSERSFKSGVERAETVNRFSFLFNKMLLFPFLYIQFLFLIFDLSDGYIVTAKKK